MKGTDGYHECDVQLEIEVSSKGAFDFIVLTATFKCVSIKGEVIEKKQRT